MKNYIVTFKDQGSERSLGIPPEQILNAVASMAEGGEAQPSRVLHCPNLGLGFVRMEPKQAIALRQNKQVLAVEEDLVVEALTDGESFIKGAAAMLNAINAAGGEYFVSLLQGKTPIPDFTPPTDWPLNNMSAPHAWKKGYTGKGIKVAVLDTGCAKNHPDLPIKGGINLVPNEAADAWDDKEGHGTHVAGRIVARHNAVGVAGVAPDCEVWAVKVLSGGQGLTSTILAGMEWAVQNGMKVINMSLGGAASPMVAYQTAVDRCLDNGCVVVAAAGNMGNTVNWPYVLTPANTPGVIAVGAVNSQNRVLPFSSRGKNPASKAVWNPVTCVAPGDAIDSTFPPQSYSRMSGTSMASPFVTGTVALLMQAYPLNKPREIVKMLQDICVDAMCEGVDEATGYGLPVLSRI